ncbi:hypothetical protein B296_00005018, partial [Ensete ventricosum]
SACFNAVQQASVGFSSGFTVAMHGLQAASPTWVILHRLWPAATVVDAATNRRTIAIATTTVLSFNSIALSPSLHLGLDCHRKRQYGRYVVLVQYGSRDCGLSGSGDHETAAEATRLIMCAAGCSLYWWMGRAAKQRGSIWDTIKGQLQTEFSDIAPSDPSSLLSPPKSGHLSLDYTCMKWNLINGRGVTAVSYSMLRRYVYTTGVDGMVCQIDTSTGSILGRFRAFTKPISSMSVSAGKVSYIEAECFWLFYPARFSLPSGKASYRSVHTGSVADRYVDRSLPGTVTALAVRGLLSSLRGERKCLAALGERPRRHIYLLKCIVKTWKNNHN